MLPPFHRQLWHARALFAQTQRGCGGWMWKVRLWTGGLARGFIQPLIGLIKAELVLETR